MERWIGDAFPGRKSISVLSRLRRCVKIKGGCNAHRIYNKDEPDLT
jgi:hypothetical protein